MNTLPRALTARFFPTTNDYIALRRQWSALMNSPRRRELTAAHHILYLALLGKDWRKGFTPPTNRRKLDNGAFLDWGLFRGLARLHSRVGELELLAPFAGLVTPEMLAQVRELAPLRNPYHYQPADFAARSFPFEAYEVPAQQVKPGTQESARA